MNNAEIGKAEIKLAVANALRYVPEELHEQLAPEFLDELLTRGRIYGYRFMPKERIYGKPIDEYKGECIEGKAFQVMIDNNLDHEVALYPYELVTYGETGQVCQNWMQYLWDCSNLMNPAQELLLQMVLWSVCLIIRKTGQKRQQWAALPMDR